MRSKRRDISDAEEEKDEEDRNNLRLCVCMPSSPAERKKHVTCDHFFSLPNLSQERKNFFLSASMSAFLFTLFSSSLLPHSSLSPSTHLTPNPFFQEREDDDEDDGRLFQTEEIARHTASADTDMHQTNDASWRRREKGNKAITCVPFLGKHGLSSPVVVV